MTTIVATRSLVGRSSTGAELEISASVGMPYRLEDGDWACPVSIPPLLQRVADIHGVDSFQALSLAIQLINSVLKDFVEKGGALSFDGEEFDP